MYGKGHGGDGLVIKFQLPQSFLILSFNFIVSHAIEHKLNHAYIFGNLSFPHFGNLHVHDILDIHNFHNGVEFEQTLN
jgi:hypothetical protein